MGKRPADIGWTESLHEKAVRRIADDASPSAFSVLRTAYRFGQHDSTFDYRHQARDAEAAGVAALHLLRKRAAETLWWRDAGAVEQKSPGDIASEAVRRLQFCANGDQRGTPTFLAASVFVAYHSAINALPAGVNGAAFADPHGYPVVVLSDTLSFRAMIETAPALALMALAQLTGERTYQDAGAMFCALCVALSVRKIYPQWDIVQGTVGGIRLYGLGLSGTANRSA